MLLIFVGMETGDRKNTVVKSVKEDNRLSQESEDRLNEPRERHMLVRPKEYLVPSYAHRHRETCKYDMATGERYQSQTGNQTKVDTKTLICDKKMSSDSRARFAKFGSPQMKMLPESTLRTYSTQVNAYKYVDVPYQPLNQSYLEDLNREQPDAVAEVFHKRHDDFVKVLKSCSKDNKLIIVLFSILAKITKAEGDHLIVLSSVLRESLFIENIAASFLLSLIGTDSDNVEIVRQAIGILKYITEHSYTSVTSFFCVFTALSDLSQEIRVSNLCTPDIKEELDQFDQIRSKITTMRLRNKNKVRTNEDKMLPPDSFRLINISPTADELLANRAPFLRRNKHIGSYNDLDHYLDVQFRLLREDFVAPLRESIHEFKNDIQDVQDGTRKLQDRRIYSSVKIAKTTTSYEGICHVLTFDSSKTKTIKWESSKRLINGSLLCLSYDNFQTIYFATVRDREPSALELGIVEVQFTCEIETVRSIADEEFVMAESTAYFEAYKHNLKALQLIQDLPFSQYIVECEDDIRPPAYLMRDEEKRYDLSTLDGEYIDDTGNNEKDPQNRKHFKECIKAGAITKKCDKTLEQVDILNDKSWPSNLKLGLDESQHRALKNALTHKFSITQGPPGTGKTFIGLKVARALLANKDIWSAHVAKQALLVVCYTNHALDQFLCGIHSFYKEGRIVRIGGRSSSDEMKQHGIKTLFHYTTQDVKDALYAAYKNANATQERINHLKYQIYKLDQKIVATVYLKKYMGSFLNALDSGFEHQKRNINKRNNMDNESDQIDLISEWLGHGVLLSDANFEVCFDQERKVKESKTDCLSYSIAYQKIVPMDEKSKETIHNIWKISFIKRWELYKSWVKALKNDLTETLTEYEDIFLRYCQDIKQANRDRNIEALRQADVIGMTTTGAAKHYKVLQSVKPKIVIVEEAAEVLEGHIITSLSDGCEHLILIGDHKQLKPSPTVYQLAKKYNLDLSLFERMINNKVTYESLEYQHRMRPEIANIIRLIYPYLKDNEQVLNKPDIRGISRNVFFITHQHNEDEEEDTLSHLNKYEAEFVVCLCRYLLKQPYQPSQITVLTTYSAQMFHLQKLMRNDSMFAGVNITVVDNYQGEENEIVLLSLVRSNSNKKVGFLKTENRINVALSRARNGLYVIGNLELFAEVSEKWANIVRLLQKEDQIGPAIPLFCRNHPDTKLCAQMMKDFENAPEGGCNLKCDARLECGHVCELKCHVYDVDHREYKCDKQCLRVCPNDHPCLKKCFEDCGDCKVPVLKTMPECDHEQTMPCFQNPLDWDCIAPCDKMCKNNHPCRKRCYEDCGNCLFDISKVIPKCGHEQNMPCFEDPLKWGWGCLAKCEKSCRNNHPCKRLCYENCNFCKVEMVKSLPRCNHKHTMCCYMDETIWRCKEDCERVCKNDHKCNKMCFEDCELCDVIFQKRMTKCGHYQLIPCFIDESEWKCNAYCEKTCKNNHKCKKLCSEDCNCTIEVAKKMPDCGHVQTIPCNVEPSKWVCKFPCDSYLECGHKCLSLCSDTHHNSHCIKIKSKERFLPVVSSILTRYWAEKDHCQQECEFILDCGHKCPRKCYEPHETKCPQKITIVLDKCSHSIEIQCYRRNWTNDCFKPCDFILECGHTCKKKCFEPHTTSCEEIVLKEKKCGHSHGVECHKDIEAVVCRKPCQYKLDCGHICSSRCSDTHTKVCTEDVEKILPCCERKLHVECREDIEKIECPFPCQEKLECGHLCTNKCSKPHTSFCKAIIGKTLPCGHVKDVFCSVKIATIKCTGHCKTILPCGHGCKNMCVEPHTRTCTEIVNYDCNYGHKTIAPCHTIYTKEGTQCNHKCHKKLACGHTCSGSCSECRGGTFHKACLACPMPDLKNHISSQMAKEGIPCLAKCHNRCEHRVCEKMCFEPCAEDGKAKWPCGDKCNAKCEHFDCPKRAFEQHENEACSDTYEMIESIADNMNKPRDIKQHAEIKKSHKSCGALVNAILVESALKQHVKHHHRTAKEVSATTYMKIAGKLHEFEEEVKIKSHFFAKHTKLHRRILTLESMIETMDHTVDLYRIYKYRLKYNRENFNNWVHFQKQGYKDLEKEIDRLERTARTILSK